MHNLLLPVALQGFLGQGLGARVAEGALIGRRGNGLISLARAHLPDLPCATLRIWHIDLGHIRPAYSSCATVPNEFALSVKSKFPSVEPTFHQLGRQDIGKSNKDQNQEDGGRQRYKAEPICAGRIGQSHRKAGNR